MLLNTSEISLQSYLLSPRSACLRYLALRDAFLCSELALRSGVDGLFVGMVGRLGVGGLITEF